MVVDLRRGRGSTTGGGSHDGVCTDRQNLHDEKHEEGMSMRKRILGQPVRRAGTSWRARGAAAALATLIGATASTAASASSAPISRRSDTSNAAKASTPTAKITVWFVTNPGPVNDSMTALAKQFDKTHPGDQVTVDFVANTPFKQKILLAMGANKPPALFFSWGGGILDQYIKAGDVVSLGNPPWAGHFLPSSLGAVTYKGQLYGVPAGGTQPVFFYYNKPLFKKYGLSFPKTWPELLSTVATFKKHGLVSPIALGDLSGWEGLMYLEYLTDRIGGPSVFDAVIANKPHAWGNPAIVKALTDIQQLVRAGAFQPGYDAVDFGSETDALMYTGRAAMTLMGDWDISSLLGEDPGFVKSGELGQAPFPSIPGGKGNAADLSGNTTTYLAIASHITAAQKFVAEQFLEDSFTTPQFAKTEVATGQVPVLKGSGALLGKTSLGRYLVPIYDSVVKAPSFQYSWDQALGSQRAQPMLTNLSKVFELTETPQQFVATLESSSTGA